MPKTHLTDLAIQNLKPTDRTDYWDDALPGFGIRVGATSKTFVIKIGGRRISLGRYPHTSLKEAREQARKQLAAPFLPERSISPSAALDEFLAHYRRRNKPRTVKDTTRLLTKHFNFRVPLHQITSRTVHVAIQDLPPSEANHAFTAMRTFLNWCVAQHYLSLTPLNKVKLPYKQQSRDRVLDDDELRNLWEVSQSRAHPFGYILCLLITTGQRIGEISKLSWSNITPTTITFPDTKNNKPHTIPYGAFTDSILKLVPRGSSSLLFPTYSESYELKVIRAQFQAPHWTPHDLRRTYSTTHARLGTPIDIIEALLNHRTGSRSGVQRIYDRYNRMEPMRAAVERHDAFLRKLLLDLPASAK